MLKPTLQIMISYSDLLTEIELIKEQIEYTKKEIKYWFGVDLDDERGIPLGSTGTYKFGMNTALNQSTKKFKSYQRLNDRLDLLEQERDKMNRLLNKLQGLDYKIAYLRIVESKTHQEIADELGYSHQYIRERWSSMKTYNEHTDIMN